MKKRLFAIITIAAMLCMSLVGCGGSSSDTKSESSNSASTESKKEDETTNAKPIKIAHYYAETHPSHIVLEKVFKPMIEEKTNGRYVVEIYPNDTLGAEKEFTEGVRLGTIEACLIGTLMSDQFPILKIADFPWIFDNVESASYALNSEEVGTKIYSTMEQAGLIGKGFAVNGVRALSNNVKEIHSIKDCSGLKLRVPEIDFFVDNVKSWGCNPITMSMSEIFTALQQGVIDGQENPPTTLLTSGWYEVQPYLALTRHQISFNMITFSKTFWDTVSDEDKKAIEEVCKATVDEQLKMYIEAEAKDIQTLKDKGIVVTEPDREPFAQAGVAVVDKYTSASPEFKEIVDLARAKEDEFLNKK